MKKLFSIITLAFILLTSSVSFGQSVVCVSGGTSCETPCDGIQYQYITTLTLPTYHWIILPSTAGTIIGSDTLQSVSVIWNGIGSALLQVCTSGWPYGELQVTRYPNPIPTITGSTTTCLNSTENYSTEPGNFNYNWTVIGGTYTGSGYNISVHWNTAGNGSVSVSYSNQGGCVGDTIKTVTIRNNPIISIVGDDSVCGGRHIYSVDNQNETYQYNWETINGIFWSGVNGPTCDIGWDNSSTSGLVKLTVNDSYNCQSNTQLPIIIFPVVSPSLTGNINTCIGTPNSYKTDENQTDYLWSINGGSIQTGQGTDSILAVWTSTGVHSLSVSYKTTTGCTAFKTFDNIYISTQPVSTIYGISDTTYMTQSTYTTEQNMLNYNWSVVGGEIIGSNNTNIIIVNWSTIGVCTISVNYDLPTGCHSTTSIKNVSISPSICMITYDTAENKNRIFVNNVPNTFDHYNIYILKQSVYEKIGEIPVSESSYLDTTSQPLLISNSYKISVSGVSESSKSPEHTTIYLSYTIQGSVVYLHWTKYNGFDFSSYKILKKVDNGNWTQIDVVSNTIFDATDSYSGGSISYYIEVDPLCIPTLKNSNSTITIKSNVQKIGNTGIFENHINTLKVYPNPTSSVINFDLKNGKNIVEIYDINGRKIYQDKSHTNKFTLNVSNYPVGVYLLKVTNEDEMSIYTGKFQKM